MSAFRLGLSKFNVNAINKSSLCVRKVNPLMRTSVATIIGVDRKDPAVDEDKPKPWPWRTKRWRLYHYYLGLDYTPRRMDQNSKIVIIDGNKGSAKEELAKALAKEFGMLYMPEPDINDLYVNHNGFDYRSLNHHLPEILHAYDEYSFYQNPYHKGVNYMQLYYFRIRVSQYVDALAHLFSTGQGVILERSPWSDFVFTDTLNKFGYLPTDVKEYYHRSRHNTVYELARPHLVIYLDVSPENLMQRIKKRNIPQEVNNKVLTPEYLKEIENNYKNRYLPEAKRHSEVLIYDWNNYGDVEDVVEDIERIDFENFDPHEEKFEDWYLWKQNLWEGLRKKYVNEKYSLIDLTQDFPHYDVDGLVIDDDDMHHRDELYQALVPNYGIIPSYDSNKVGLWKTLWTMKLNYREEPEHLIRYPFY